MSKLGKRTDQRMAMLKNQVSELLWYGQIETTVDRAKAVRSLAEKYITIAMRAYPRRRQSHQDRYERKGRKERSRFHQRRPQETRSTQKTYGRTC